MKKCTKCNVLKPFDEFNKHTLHKDGLTSQCRCCIRLKRKEDKPRIDAYNQSKKPVQNAQMRDHYRRNTSYYHAKVKKRRAQKVHATPIWFEEAQVRVLYAKAAEWGFDVDHIVPMQSDKVCGLHCWSNLQLLDPALNRSKGNRSWPDMP